MEYIQKIKIITVATKESGYLKWLKESCIRNGTELIVLGMGVEWKGYITKIDLVNDFLKDQDDRDIFCFVDAYDVIMLKNIEELKDFFIKTTNETNTKIICSIAPRQKIGIEIIDKPIDDIFRRIFNVSDSLKHINSGCYIGYCKDLKYLSSEIMKIHKETGEVDDEKILNFFYSQNVDLVYVDEKLDFNFNCIDILDRKDYGQHSFFIHRVGNLPLINFLEENGYILTFEDKIRLFNESLEMFYKKSIYHAKQFFEQN